MENSIKLIEISVEQAINHSQNSYNPYEWEKKILNTQKWFGNVDFYECNNEVYKVYFSNGIKFIKRMEYSSSLDNAGYKSYFFKNGELREYPVKITKSKESLKFAKDICKMSENIVFASVYFSI